MKASAIPETEYYNHDNRVYGMLYQMKGNTASPIQFYLTDSTKHFFRAALYFNNIPNQDSLAPVIDYLREDIMMMMETFRWK
jgi:gliding motility-associated lipoprotein GldD